MCFSQGWWVGRRSALSFKDMSVPENSANCMLIRALLRMRSTLFSLTFSDSYHYWCSFLELVHGVQCVLSNEKIKTPDDLFPIFRFIFCQFLVRHAWKQFSLFGRVTTHYILSWLSNTCVNDRKLNYEDKSENHKLWELMFCERKVTVLQR